MMPRTPAPSIPLSPFLYAPFPLFDLAFPNEYESSPREGKKKRKQNKTKG